MEAILQLRDSSPRLIALAQQLSKPKPHRIDRTAQTPVIRIREQPAVLGPVLAHHAVRVIRCAATAIAAHMNQLHQLNTDGHAR